jgi:hypothetical protein
MVTGTGWAASNARPGFEKAEPVPGPPNLAKATSARAPTASESANIAIASSQAPVKRKGSWALQAIGGDPTPPLFRIQEESSRTEGGALGSVGGPNNEVGQTKKHQPSRPTRVRIIRGNTRTQAAKTDPPFKVDPPKTAS